MLSPGGSLLGEREHAQREKPPDDVERFFIVMVVNVPR